MKRSTNIAATLAVGLLIFASAIARCATFTGEVIARAPQPIFTPPAMSTPVVLRFFAADGQAVRTGDVVLRIDAGEASAQVRALRLQIANSQTKAAQTKEDLELKVLDAEIEVIKASAAVDVAEVSNAIPPQLLSALERDKNAGELDRARKDYEAKSGSLKAAREAVARSGFDASLDLQKLEIQCAYY